MKFVFSILAVSLLAFAESGLAQSFVNLDFEDTTLTWFLRNAYLDSYATNATVPGWNWSPLQTFGYGDPNTTVAFNDIALDSPAVTLQGTDSPFAPAIEGEYSIFLQGGSASVPSTSYSSIWQTGQIPSDAKSIIYWGGALQVSFNGQPLTPVAINNAANYTVWGMDILAYAGQTGELRFTKPSQNTSWDEGTLLDNIQFSPVQVPEPGVLGLLALGGLFFGLRRRQTQTE